MGLPYREDGAIDEQGRYTTFEPPRRIFDTPGVNCSGLAVALWRLFTGSAITLDQAVADVNANSGPGAPLGLQWDFGFDLLLNLLANPGQAAGRPLALLEPAGRRAADLAALRQADPMQLRGLSAASVEDWKKVAALLRPGELALVTFSKPATRPGYRLLHYHVALLAADEAGHVWFHHATPKTGSHRFDLATAAGVAALVKEFSGGTADKRVLALGIGAR